jgi:hypothetical protein
MKLVNPNRISWRSHLRRNTAIARYSSSSCPPPPEPQASQVQEQRRIQEEASHRAGQGAPSHGRIKARRMSHGRAEKRITSSAARHILNQPETPFSPTLCSEQAVTMHMLFTPSHMPLTLNLGTSQYTKPRDISEKGRHPQLRDMVAYPSSARPDLFFEKPSEVELIRREGHVLNQHLNELGGDIPGFSTTLSEHHTWSGLDEANSNSSGITLSRSSERTNHFISRFAPKPSREDLQWSNVLSAMSAAQHRLSPSTTNKTQKLGFTANSPHSALLMSEHSVRREAENNRSSIDSAVKEVEDLLVQLDLDEADYLAALNRRSSSPFVRASGPGLFKIRSRRDRDIVFRSWALERVRMKMMEETEDDHVWMDSVKRKRQKKISKHKSVDFLSPGHGIGTNW